VTAVTGWPMAGSPGKLAGETYYVNWFRKDGAGRYLWPGFGDNSRVLKWIVERLNGHADAIPTPIGGVPGRSLDTAGLSLSHRDLGILLSVDRDEWQREAALIPPTSKPSAPGCRPRCYRSATPW